MNIPLLILGLLAAVVAHEGGHALAARSFGFRSKFVVSRLKIATRLNVSRAELSPQQDLVIAAAGPAASVLLGIAIWIVAGNAWLAAASVELGVLSLIPIKPQDGYWIARAALKLTR